MYLPEEILKEVGQYLKLSEKANCIRVCYDWYDIFLDLIYSQVHITSRHQFRLFFNSIKHSSVLREEDALGSQVKELYLVTGISRDELESFPTYFTQLTILNFDPRLWKYMRADDNWSTLFKSWKSIVQFPPLTRSGVLTPLYEHVGHQLKSLSLWGDPLLYILKNNLDTSIWSKMPRLEKLSLQGIIYTTINVKMFMAIGAHLPLLNKLTLSCVTLSLDESYLASTTTLPLFSSTTTLILDDVHIRNWRMVTLMTLAFYHVQTLDFDVTFDWLLEEVVSSEVYEKSMDAWMGFSQLCFSLEKVVFRRIETSSYPFPYEAFFHELADISGRQIKVDMYERAWGRTVDPASTFKFGTIRTGLLSNVVMLWSWTGKKTDISLFKYLRACPFLKEVTLSCDVTLRNGFRLDLLLDSCPQVEVVRIANTLMTTSRPIECAADIKYNLKSLSMKNAILGDHFMDYVAKCCPKLTELTIDSSTQQKPRQSVFIIIRMPDHEFELIQIDSLHLNPGAETNVCRTEAAILSFYESKRYHSQDERRKARQKQYPEQKIPPAEMWRFYHVYKPSVNTKKERLARRLQRLSTTEAARVANFEMTAKKWNSIRNTQPRKSFEQKQAWEKDIPFGTVLLLCKSVNRLMFNEIRV